MMLTMKQRERAKRLAQEVWDGLDHVQRGDLDDVMVLEGTAATYEWLEIERVPGLLTELDQLRIYWEIALS